MEIFLKILSNFILCIIISVITPFMIIFRRWIWEEYDKKRFFKEWITWFIISLVANTLLLIVTIFNKTLN